MARKDISNKLIIFGSEKKTEEFRHSDGKRSYLKKLGITMQGRREVEVGTLLLGNDKNNVIACEVLIYFWCLNSKFEVYVAHFGTK